MAHRYGLPSNGGEMQYLKAYKHAFGHRVRHGDLFLHLQNETAEDILKPIAELIARRRTHRLRKGIACCLSGVRSRLFVKTVELDSFPNRLRATLGLRRRDGAHIWPVAELLNTVDAFHRGAPVPRVLGFGYRRRGVSLVRELFLVSEMLDGHVNGQDWLRGGEADVEAFVRSCFGLFHELHERQVFHLDLWLANIMLDPARP